MSSTKKTHKDLSSDELLDINAILDRFNSEGFGRMSGFRHMHRAAIRYMYGDQHAHRKMQDGWHYPVMNRVFADILQEIAILTANNPTIKGVPVEDTDISTAEMITSVLRGMWTESLNMRLKIMQALLDSKLSGIHIAKWRWIEKDKWDMKKAAKDGKGWQGKVDVMIWNPENFGCDDSVELAAEIPTKANFVWFSSWVHKEQAAKMYPNYRKKLIAEDIMDEDGKLKHAAGGSTAGGSNTSGGTGESFDTVNNDWTGESRFKPATMAARLANIILGSNRDDDANSKSGSKSNKKVNYVKIEEYFYRDTKTKHWPAQTVDLQEGEPGMENMQKDSTGQWVDRSKPIIGHAGTNLGYEKFDGTFPTKTTRPAFDEPLYPTGRFVTRIDREFIEQDMAWPFPSWPVAVGANNLLPHMWQGVNAVEMSMGSQDMLNTISSHMEAYTRFFADPVLEVEKGALAPDRDKKKPLTIGNFPGAVVSLMRGGLSKFRVREPVSLSRTIFDIYTMFKEQGQDIIGVHDINQGKASKGDQTLGELQMLNRNSRQRIAMQGAMLDVWLKQVATGIVELMQVHLEPEQYVRIVGADEDSVESSIKWSKKMQVAKLDIKFEPISTMPVDEEREVKRTIEAYKLVGPAMLPEVLKKLNIPNSDEIVEKHGLLGPFQQLMESVIERGGSSEDVMAALQQVLKIENMETEQAKT